MVSAGTVEWIQMQWDEVQKRLVSVIGLLAFMWVFQLINEMHFSNMLFTMGIFPRVLDGLSGVILAPLIHGDFNHLIVNSGPFLVLGLLVSLTSIKRFFLLTMFIGIAGGLLVWLVARSQYHIGSSILVFGYFSYLLCHGWYQRSFVSIAVSALTAAYYGWMLLGLLPVDKHVSWEAHICGFVVGIIAARLAYTKEELKEEFDIDQE